MTKEENELSVTQAQEPEERKEITEPPNWNASLSYGQSTSSDSTCSEQNLPLSQTTQPYSGYCTRRNPAEYSPVGSRQDSIQTWQDPLQRRCINPTQNCV